MKRRPRFGRAILTIGSALALALAAVASSAPLAAASGAAASGAVPSGAAAGGAAAPGAAASAAVRAPWREVSVDGGVTCGIRTDGTLWCWGWAYSLEGPVIETPQELVPGTRWARVAAGDGHSCAIRVDGGMWCWGNNAFGELGTGGAGDQAPWGPGTMTPTQVVGDARWAEVAVGYQSTCGIRVDGTLWCWGNNVAGALGLGRERAGGSVPVPTRVGSGTAWRRVSASRLLTCAVRSDGTLWCWGDRSAEHDADGTLVDQLEPTRLGTDAEWTSVVVGPGAACGLRALGELWCWGSNNRGQLGDGTTTDRAAPVRVGAGRVWTAVTLGQEHTCAVTADGGLWCWGTNGDGQLGDVAGDSAVPRRVVVPGVTWTGVATGLSHTCGVTADHRLLCWGSNEFGQLGARGLPDSYVVTDPLRVAGELPSVTLTARGGHACAIASDGGLRCWGSNNHGQLGDGTATTRYAPVPVAGPRAWADVTAGDDDTCGIAADRTLWCWGSGSGGQLGDGTSTDRSSPVRIGEEGSRWRDVAAGGLLTCAVRDDGTLWCWGQYESWGERPRRIGTATTWTSVSAGWSHACATTSDHGLWCWGADDVGQLGDDETRADQALPVRVAGSWRTVTTGGGTTCAVRDDESLWCWGRGSWGELGDGTTTEAHTPRRVAAAGRWADVATSGEHTCGVRRDGTLACWGRNTTGQLGAPDLSTNDVRVPRQVGPARTWQRVATGDDVTCAIRDDGTWCWGEARGGQLGGPLPRPPMAAVA